MITTMSDDCDYNFGTFDNFGVKNDQKVSRYMGQLHGGRGQGKPPPLFGQCPKENVFFCEVFPDTIQEI